MKRWIYIQSALFVLSLIISTATAIAQAPQPGYVPPDAGAYGLEAHNEHLAVIETNCADVPTAIEMRNALTRSGALVSIITSPGRMLAWVPPAARAAVAATRLETAAGDVSVLSVSYNGAEFDKNRTGDRIDAVENDADRAIVAFLDFIKQPLTEEDRRLIAEREKEFELQRQTHERKECTSVLQVDEALTGEITGGLPAIGGERDPFLRNSPLKGLIVHSSFFVESKAGTGTWDWDTAVYAAYRNYYIAGMNYWVSFAARYGKTISTIWRLYSPSNMATQVDGEPTVVGEAEFIPDVVARLSNPPAAAELPDFGGEHPGAPWCWWYNNKVRDDYSADAAICGFIAFKPTGKEAIWPHAIVIEEDGDREGVYFVMDTRCWQSLLNPFHLPMRNVVAHEIGHLWGCPDEYGTENCDWSHNGLANINCQTKHPAYGRPGFDMRGWDGIMVECYIGGNSVATPVHAGVIAVAETAPVRIYSSEPTDIRLSFRNCDNIRNLTMTTPIGVAVDFDYCHSVKALSKVVKGGETWYFDRWEVKRESGATRVYNDIGIELPSSAYTSTFEDPVIDIKAVYTNIAPDIFAENTSLEAQLCPLGTAASPMRTIALKWRNQYDMSEAETIIEYEAFTDDWMPLSTLDASPGPAAVPIGDWVGVVVHRLPNPYGPGSVSIEPGIRYRFRILGEVNTNRGTPSATASVTTRPDAPPEAAYCYDSNEPNSLSSPKILAPAVTGMSPYTVKAAIPISGLAGEFGWFTPSNDYYRITVNGVSDRHFGERVRLTLRVKDGSNFRPLLRALRAGAPTHITAHSIAGVYVLNLTSDGQYLLKVESNMSQNDGFDFVNPVGGYFGFGEYELTVERTQPIQPTYETCVDCVKLIVAKPFPGEIIMTPHPKFDLFTRGLSRSASATFNMHYQTPPGYSFLGFGGDMGLLQNNPSPVTIGTNMSAGEYEVYPIIEPISSATAELVIIHPEGAEGPFELRSSGAVGSVLNAEAKPPTGYDFVGWGGDTTGTTNPMPVTLWRSKRLIAHYRPVPCQPEPMTAWNHQLLFRNARQNDLTLDYGMAAGAGDGLESGQTDLPPIPPPTAVDIRWINMPGSQGSPTDLRAIKSKHTFQGRVQTGGTAPVDMTWNAPSASPNADYTLKVQGTAGSIDMRTASSFEFVDEGTYIFTIEVKEGACPEPTKENEILVTPVDVRDRGWPCVELRLRLTDRSTGEILPYYNPYFLRFSEKLGDGSRKPMQLRGYTQMDSVLIVRLCGDPANTNPGRDIEIINDNDDDTDQRVDTILVPIPPPIPTGNGDPERFVFTSAGEWEMVSTPLLLKDSQTESLFSDPTLRLYGFDTQAGGYTAANAMEFGRGYWMNSDAKDAILIGLSQPSYEWATLKGIGEPYGYGWNMIGSMFKPVAVSAIAQTPAGGLKAIYGWDPSSGYVVPTSILPGKGYWVRVDPGTKLKMTLSSATGGSAETAYRKTVNQLDIASVLTITDDAGASRSLYISGSDLSQIERDILALPAPPPSGVLDARTGEGSSFLHNGENLVQLRGDGRIVISMQIPSPRVRLELRDEADKLLGTFSGEAGESVLVDVEGTRNLKLHAAVQPALAESQTLGSNYPNPFQISTRTSIPYRVTEAGNVRLAVFDLLGRELRTLVNDDQATGSKVAQWDGRDQRGDMVPAGVYIYRIQTAAGTRSRTLTIVR